MSKEPEFPLVDFGEPHPPEKAALEVWPTSETFGLCSEQAHLRGAWSKGVVYSRNGIRYRITGASPEPRVTVWRTLVTSFRPGRMLKVEVRLEEDQPWQIGQVKERIRALLAHDSGDNLYQWTDEQEWEAGLQAASTPSQLIDFLVKAVFGEEVDFSQSAG
jgi:hypothetical protein